jgi:hypothetical protein
VVLKGDAAAAAESGNLNSTLVAQYRRDGVVMLPAALSQETCRIALAAYEWSLSHPGPGAAKLPPKGTGTFYQDLANPAAFATYRSLIRQPEIGDIVTSLWGSLAVWFMYEQVFKKTGGSTRRTPWHQDSSYLPVQGRNLSVMWISFEAVAKEHALEFVRGSHQGTLYDGSRFDPDDDTAPLYGDGVLPRLPDIEAERERWPIVSWATEPGDVVVFHPAVLHGGAATDESFTRRTLSLRFFGEDARVAARPGAVAAENQTQSFDSSMHPLSRMRLLPDGTRFRDPGFPQIRPIVDAGAND